MDDPRVAAIGACNTVLFGADGTRGFNTDYSGFAATFRAAFPGATPGVVAVAGAGGVGKAIGFAMTDLGATALQIFDENRSKAEDLKDTLVGIAPDMTVSVAATIEDAAAGADGLVNCTPLGMVGYSGTAFPKPLMRSQRWAFDAVYTPVDTQFMMDARDHGLETVSGYELFFHQGVEAFQIFTGRNVVPIALRAKLTES